MFEIEHYGQKTMAKKRRTAPVKGKDLAALKELMAQRNMGGDTLPLQAPGPGSDMTKLYANREE